jgi:hypothetical protein
MKRVVMFSVVAVALSTVAMQAQTPQVTGCSNANLSGSFGVLVTGTRPAPSALPNGNFLTGYIEQVSGVVVQIFDGKGTFTQTDNLKGSVSGITANRVGSGTYTVNADCSGTYTLNVTGVAVPVVTQIVVVSTGTQFWGTVVSPQTTMTTATGRQM